MWLPLQNVPAAFSHCDFANFCPCWGDMSSFVYERLVQRAKRASGAKSSRENLVGAWPCERPYVRKFVETQSEVETPYFRSYHFMINWPLSKQGIHLPVSHDHITGSGLELIEATCFLKVVPWPINVSIRSQAQVFGVAPLLVWLKSIDRFHVTSSGIKIQN